MTDKSLRCRWDHGCVVALLLSLALVAPATTAAAARCEKPQPLVVLWHRDTPRMARATVTHVLADACFKVEEQFDGARREATEMADLLGLPLLNVKAVPEPGATGVAEIAIGLYVIDASLEQLKVIASAGDRVPAPAQLDARGWRALGPRIAAALATVRGALSASAAAPR